MFTSANFNDVEGGFHTRFRVRFQDHTNVRTDCCSTFTNDSPTKGQIDCLSFKIRIRIRKHGFASSDGVIPLTMWL